MRTMMSNMSLARLPKISKKKLIKNKKNKKQKIINNNINFKKDNQKNISNVSLEKKEYSPITKKTKRQIKYEKLKKDLDNPAVGSTIYLIDNLNHHMYCRGLEPRIKHYEIIFDNIHFKCIKCLNCNKFFILEDDYNNFLKNDLIYHFEINEKNTPKNKKEEIENVVCENIDFFIKGDNFKCYKNHHNLIDIRTDLSVINIKGNIEKIKCLASHCVDCNIYYILTNEFERIKKHGVIFHKVISEKQYIDVNNGNSKIGLLNEESILHMYGYNVGSFDSLSDVQRQVILSTLIDYKIIDRNSIISHLNFLINRSKNNDTLEKACDKWKKDLSFVKGYKINSLKNYNANKLIFKSYKKR